MFSIMTMASSTTKPVEMVSAMRVRLFRLKPSRYMTPKVPTSDSGTATLGMVVAGRLRRNRKMTSTTRATASISSILHVLHRRADGGGAVGQDRDLDRGGQRACSCGSSFLIRSTTSMTLAPGWRWMLTITAGVVFIQAA